MDSARLCICQSGALTVGDLARKWALILKIRLSAQSYYCKQEQIPMLVTIKVKHL